MFCFCVVYIFHGVKLLCNSFYAETESESRKFYEVHFNPKVFERGGNLEMDVFFCRSYISWSKIVM